MYSRRCHVMHVRRASEFDRSSVVVVHPARGSAEWSVFWHPDKQSIQHRQTKGREAFLLDIVDGHITSTQIDGDSHLAPSSIGKPMVLVIVTGSFRRVMHIPPRAEEM